MRVTADGQTRCCSTSTSSRAATACRSRRRPARLDSGRIAEPPGVQLARPGTTRANWWSLRPRSVRDAIMIGALLAAPVLLLFLRNIRITLIAVARGAGRAGRDHPAAVRAGHELQHHDARRHGRGGRADHRRRYRDDRAHHARRISGRGRDAVHGRMLAGRARVHAAAGRVVGRDDHDLPAARLPLRRHRRVLQGAVADHGRRAAHLVPGHLARGADPGRPRAQRRRCEPHADKAEPDDAGCSALSRLLPKLRRAPAAAADRRSCRCSALGCIASRSCRLGLHAERWTRAVSCSTIAPRRARR